MRESFVLAFAGGDGQSEPILRRRQRTGGVRSESAGRILRFVEVQNHAAIPRRIRIEKPRGRVRGLAAGLVAEHEEETPALRGSLQSVAGAAALELHVAGLSDVSCSPMMVSNTILAGVAAGMNFALIFQSSATGYQLKWVNSRRALLLLSFKRRASRSPRLITSNCSGPATSASEATGRTSVWLTGLPLSVTPGPEAVNAAWPD